MAKKRRVIRRETHAAITPEETAARPSDSGKPAIGAMAVAARVAAAMPMQLTPKALKPVSLARGAEGSHTTVVKHPTSVPMSPVAAVISKPTQSFVSWRTGARIGPAQPFRVRIVR
jgi:hypothetical protein